MKKFIFAASLVGAMSVALVSNAQNAGKHPVAKDNKAKTEKTTAHKDNKAIATPVKTAKPAKGKETKK